MELVWFKRDLRVQDHAPLARAAARGEVMALYVIEPEYWALPDTSMRQWLFVRECLQELQSDLAKLGVPLQVRVGQVTEVLAELHNRHVIDRLWSHEETGNQWTYTRDIAVGQWASAGEIEWIEIAQHGVVRRLADRDGWAAKWQKLMEAPVIPAPIGLRPYLHASLSRSPDLPHLPFDSMRDDHCVAPQRGGRAQALQLVTGFLSERGERYQKEMSSPLTAGHSCSRLSAHIACGVISMREVSQLVGAAVELRQSQKMDERGSWVRSLSSYAARLHWHCHFIQKLEDDPAHEAQDVHSAYIGMRSPTADPDVLQAWCRGQTGYPFIDACMRSLIHTGWLNFRMRAMLLSFASYQLWLHWREPGLHLARMFVDYEPGIHWNQVQMQSGTTGINTVRIYNPVKQSIDQDPQGVFIRRWVPELQAVDNKYIHEPWKMSLLEQQLADCRPGCDYPEPLVDHLAAARSAREAIHSIRKSPEFRREADIIQQRHGSRKSGVRRRDQRKPRGSTRSSQLSLDLGQ